MQNNFGGSVITQTLFLLEPSKQNSTLDIPCKNAHPNHNNSSFGEASPNKKTPNSERGDGGLVKGYDISLNHQDWFKNSSQNLNSSRLFIGTVADLIDQGTNTWKLDLVRALYPYLQWFEIMKIPLSKTGSISDKLLWKYSITGDFKVKIAYKLLVEDSCTSSQNQSKPAHIQNGVWKQICKIKVPMRICNFVWRLMHDSLLTLLTLKNRDISTQSNCPLCNTVEDSISHLFWHYPFARACWHGLTLVVHTFDLLNTSM